MRRRMSGKNRRGRKGGKESIGGVKGRKNIYTDEDGEKQNEGSG